MACNTEKQKRVVITGIGPVTALGVGNEQFFANLYAAKTCIQPIPVEFEKYYAFNSKYYVPYPECSLEDYGISSMYNSIVQMEDRYAVVGAKLALEDAGFPLDNTGRSFQVAGLPSRCDIIIGTGFSGLENAFIGNLAYLNPDLEIKNEQIKARLVCSRMIVPMTMPNSAAAWVSIFYNLKGASFTINASCASGTIAIGEAFHRVASGRSRAVLAGGVEYLHDDYGYIMRSFDILGALTKAVDGKPGPFSHNRSGFLFAEGGGCMLVLEELEHAQQRNAQIYAEIIDFQSNSDAYNIVKIDPVGEQIKKLLTELKGDKRIDYINAHGTATESNDEIESAAIKDVFGITNQPAINSTKGIAGHSIGASGAIEAGVAAYAIKNALLHPNMANNPIADLNLVNGVIAKHIDYALSMSYGFGGHNAGLLFKRYINE